MTLEICMSLVAHCQSMNMDNSSIMSPTLSPDASLADVIAATIPDLPINEDSSSLDQYLYQQNVTTTTGSSQHRTPKTKPRLTIQTPQTNFFSPGGDSRFNDSLTGLLGSPPPNSPLAKNPFFTDLQAVLANEFTSTDSLSDSLLFTMTTQPNQDVFNREHMLQQRFERLQQHNPTGVKELADFYRLQAATVETDRFRQLQSNNYPNHYERSLNSHYDNQLHQIMDRVEKSLLLLESSCQQFLPAQSSTKQRPHLSKKAIRQMEDWYEQNLEHPYPSNKVIDQIAQSSNIQTEQVKKWFANKRNRNHNTRTLTEIARQKRKLAMAS